MTADEQRRIAEMKDVFQYGDEDAQEIALIEILNLGAEAGMEIEQLVPNLLWDLTREDK